MKTINKVFGLAILAASLFTACSKDQHVYEPGKPAGKYDVYFAADNDNTVVLPLEAKSFTVSVERADGAGAISVPVSLWCSDPDLLQIPTEVTFQEGQTQADLLVAIVGDMKPFNNYMMNIKIAEEYTQPYAETDVYPQYGVTLYKEDYEVVDTGVWQNSFLYVGSWEQDLEYSTLLDQYRFKDVWEPGSGFTFKWDGESKKLKLQSGSIYTGIIHPSYGLVSAKASADVESVYLAEYRAFDFYLTYTVSAGSFGDRESVYFFSE